MSAEQEALRRFRGYPAYKESGVEWLGEIPAHWEVRRLKFAARLEAGQSPPSELVTDGSEGLPFLQGNADFGSVNPTPRQVCNMAPKRTRPADILLSVRAPVGAMNIADQAYGIGRGLCAIRPADGIDLRFFFHLLTRTRSELGAVATGSTYDAVTTSQVGDLPMLLPPPAEQRTIAAFLDRETARIDELVAKKERLIELLQEKRTSLIEAAVGGAPASPETKLGYYVDLLPGYAFPSDHFSHDPDDIRLLRGVNISPDGIRWDDTVLWPVSGSARYAEYRLREGDLVFGMDRPWISAGIRVAELNGADVPTLLLQRVARLRARPGLSQRYLKLVLSSPQFRAYFEPILTGISVPHVSPEQILSFRIRLPPLDIQEAAWQGVQTQVTQIESMCDVLRNSITRLKELRTALISAAVTGKIDVREEAA